MEEGWQGQDVENHSPGTMVFLGRGLCSAEDCNELFINKDTENLRITSVMPPFEISSCGD